jgi:hypothetical protein
MYAVAALVAFGTVALSLISGLWLIVAVVILGVLTLGFLFLVPRWWPAQ